MMNTFQKIGDAPNTVVDERHLIQDVMIHFEGVFDSALPTP